MATPRSGAMLKTTIKFERKCGIFSSFRLRCVVGIDHHRCYAMHAWKVPVRWIRKLGFVLFGLIDEQLQ